MRTRRARTHTPSFVLYCSNVLTGHALARSAADVVSTRMNSLLTATRAVINAEPARTYKTARCFQGTLTGRKDRASARDERAW